MQALYGGGARLQVARGIYTLFSLAEKWKLVAIQKLRRSFLGLADLHGELHPEAYRIVKIT
jgi:hypothetical protein